MWLSGCGVLGQMSDDAKIRRENLKRLGLRPGQLRDKLGSSLAYWRDLMETDKSFGERIARRIEEGLGLPRGSLDVAPVDVRQSGAPSIHEVAQLLQPLWLAPEISWDRIGGVLLLTNDAPEVATAAVRQRQVYSEDAGRRSKFVQVQDDALTGRAAKGVVLLIDPDSPAEPGSIVLVRDERGNLMLRIYRVVSGSTWEAASTRPDAYATIPGERLKVLGRARQLVSLDP